MHGRKPNILQHNKRLVLDDARVGTESAASVHQFKHKVATDCLCLHAYHNCWKMQCLQLQLSDIMWTGPTASRYSKMQLNWGYQQALAVCLSCLQALYN